MLKADSIKSEAVTHRVIDVRFTVTRGKDTFLGPCCRIAPHMCVFLSVSRFGWGSVHFDKPCC